MKNIQYIVTTYCDYSVTAVLTNRCTQNMHNIACFGAILLEIPANFSG